MAFGKMFIDFIRSGRVKSIIAALCVVLLYLNIKWRTPTPQGPRYCYRMDRKTCYQLSEMDYQQHIIDFHEELERNGTNLRDANDCEHRSGFLTY
ncbi:hypothetical protein P171DRAFT_437685 [Karstenula rhodostoma CBS 690.94]|uniref:Uncharacterized protein n=1 Tax=Karstenula rhodostoma CBS 690.94 TaxID=1392251 RepID=A0A9P4P3H5_9PLEO|nr:hypothetical protein P171DRAFT_437685 [Karstenula rhodostoma CBS 690.94]